ncbi:MAG: 30S ribosome-binding factor RbfA [Spirochaetes bacterium]|nr:MAG: 30S ribosome-binding factor RbfA [Spirochaetota bacterium]RKX99098.1 MAG: 30S ribosome-binding factor RbfA [Spirochaetota bacterium]
MNEIRLKRVESLIRDKVSSLIMMGEVKDPRVDSTITLTRVKAAGDLASARVWVSSFGGEEATQRAVKGLNNAAGFIQSRLGKEIHMRNTPKLYFSADNSIREGLMVNQLIDEVVSSTSHEDDGVN